MRKKLLTLLMMLVLVTSFAIPAFAYETWNHMVDDMEQVITQAQEAYTAGNAKEAKEKVDEAYFQYYEKLGFEKTVMSYISGNRAAQVEYQFSFAKKAISGGESSAAVNQTLDELAKMLREDANQLDGKEESAVGVFLASLLIITREGFEAIIIVGAIVAYLIKSGNKDKTKAVYWGSLIALGASVIMALILNALSGDYGASQEVVEGVTMLIAVAVLFYVSNWMVSKSEAEAWSRYIEGKVESSISKGSMFSLSFAAFLAVFREGAETILFYKALLAGTQTYINMVWVGLGVGSVLLVVIYIMIRFMSIKLPLKPFFLGTSILLFVMSISFLGSGIKELQEGNVIGVTAIPNMGSIDLLGIYPTVETLVPQILLLAVTVATFVIQMRKTKKAKAAQQKLP